MRQLCALDVAPVPWRNGGGLTRELLTWPSPQDWRCRLSVADIASEGPFSAFPGVARHFVVLEGDGVALAFDGEPVEQCPSNAPLVFDGALTPSCHLLGGPVRDLNLMIRGGSGGMAAVLPGAAWQAPVGAQAGQRLVGLGYGPAQCPPQPGETLDPSVLRVGDGGPVQVDQPYRVQVAGVGRWQPADR